MPSMSETQTVFAGQRMLLDAEGALFWPQEQCLILSDLHLEKGSFLAQFGAMLPQYDTAHSLLRLEGLVHRYRPQKVICLGDSFHDAKAYGRLQPEDRDRLFGLIVSAADWHWVLGNHDPKLAQDLPGHQHERMRLGNISLMHQPEPDAYPQIIGHYHPKVTLHLGHQRVTGRAFLHDQRLLILPAFGSYAGGLDAQDEAIVSLLSEPSRYLIYRDRIWKV